MEVCPFRTIFIKSSSVTAIFAIRHFLRLTGALKNSRPKGSSRKKKPWTNALSVTKRRQPLEVRPYQPNAANVIKNKANLD